MRHQNSVFHSLTKQIPWSKFEQVVEKYGADRLVRKLTTKRHFIALLYGQLSGSTSLREIVTGMASHETRLYHVGAAPVKRSTMSDANSQRPWQVFSELFAQMLPQAHRGLRRATADAVRLIDSTSIRLSSLSESWATFSADVFGAKAHIVYDPNADRPVYFAVTPANVNDITAAKAMPIELGATYVYDLGYYDYGWWAKLDEAGCRFVTRLKKNTPLDVIRENHVSKNSNIVSDRIGHLPARLANSRKNPLQVPVREICVVIESGKQLRIVTNDLDASAEEIAELYKQRWQIELFFRWVKQTLRIRHFIGVSENAVRIQIAIALIAFLLLRMAQLAQKAVHSPLEFARLVRTNLMHRRPINNLLEPLQSVPINQNQLNLGLYFQ
ncbi:IS4 family transposase [Bradyrhizobium guangzhouense]|uniref:IS4 family transposase n=3 Tax=Bradyrhizobium guangzhouense TaxID=1325095 RepID=A0AAE6CA56_9BRAD|nr:IS4 family transposase [Bradyrhizobium guangzhouense]QAU45441.1 IS4 family transposase [Bradyrhizobium guangzhouense]QAU47562.1 IS4 family transposase [Bradyrhizobium guangzhouense]QAU47669.1 IS4 family transposase [Bradyrhizobium guangzhouense]QAU47670.1 IS4 family transposase [Bradyrhizobium guangzhouense]QAU47702.1 IS4 family transposase [Bradyrhizobium guangzhouense]